MPELRIVLTIAAIVVAMLLAAAMGIRQRVGALILGLLGFVWLTLDSRFEGAVLFTISDHNGFTASDLVGVAGMVVAALQLWRLRRGSLSARRDASPEVPLHRS